MEYIGRALRGYRSQPAAGRRKLVRMRAVTFDSNRSPSRAQGAAPRRTAARAPLPAAESLMRTCPNCSTELEERKCKLFCPRPGCGYFLSCADFY